MTPALLFLIIAFGLIATELLIMQFSVFWFLFFGIGAFVTSLLCWLMPEISITLAIGVFVVASLITAAILFPPLKRWQQKPSPLPGNDAIGQKAKVIEAITEGGTGKVVWSGTEWPAQIDSGETALAVGETATIRKLEGIRLIVGR